MPETDPVSLAFAAAMRASMCYFLVFASAYFLTNTLFYRVQDDPGYIPALSLATLLLCICACAYNRQKPSLVRLEVTGHVVGPAFIANALLDIYIDYQSIKLMYLVLLVPAFAASGVRPRVVYATSIVSIGGLLFAAYQLDPGQLMSCVWVAFAALVVAIGLSSVMLTDFAQALKAISRFSRLGCRIALDDFGSGYTNFGYLNRVGGDTVKIDRSFVLELDQNDRAGKIIKSIIDLADNLGIEHVVEGVETPHELLSLQSVGAAQVQGYLFGKPMPAAEIADYLNRLNESNTRRQAAV